MINLLKRWKSRPDGGDAQKPVGRPVFIVPEDTLFLHTTHPKAGSQWVQAIFFDLFGRHAVPNHAGNGMPAEGQFHPGRIYLSVYLLPGEISAVVPLHAPMQSFFVMRDLRDTLVSLYFSLKVSHAVLDEFMASARKRLNTLSEAEGMIFLIETQLRNTAKLQRSWFAQDPNRCVKFEELTGSPEKEMQRVIRGLLGIDVPEDAIVASCRKFAFEQLAGGRKRGEEDAKSHFRSGAAGGWKKHFSPEVTEAFKDEFPGLLQTVGYEVDENWHGLTGDANPN